MPNKTMKTKIQVRRDTTANWLTNKDVVPAAGEPCFDLELGTLKIGDGTKTYSQLPFDDEDIYNALAGKCDASVFINTTLTASNWSNKQQTLAVAGLGTEQNGVIGISQSITDEQFTAAADACLYVCAQGAGSITVAAKGTVPECDIPVTVILLS